MPNANIRALIPVVQNQVSFQLPSNGPYQQINYLSHVPSQNSVLNKNEPIIVQALFNNTLVNYMCDSGADITVIDVKTYLLIKRHEPSTILEEYHGGKLYSASGEIKIFETDSDTNLKPIENENYKFGFNNFHKQKNLWCSNLRDGQDTKCANIPNISWWKK
ncbi:unnamed protein product [Brachionus calyciflorus]|uniref:Peptidase A2 domain-containing protein n=1 Tax=Brachionus calyciflorus TaxID=104777 RepID=A0A813YZP9_9BILA|nr:unnamed protein product [Brachionus calyciflorus]